MARPNKIWFRRDTGWWMITINGKKIRLAEGKASRKLAEQKFHELKAVQARPADRSDSRVVDIIEMFLAWSKAHRSDETNRNHIYYGQKFAEHAGLIRANELRPIDVTNFIDQHQWGQTTERNARRSIYRAFSWAVEEGLLPVNPLKGMRCPGAKARQRAMTDEEFRTILKSSTRPFKLLIFSLRMTGCRPKEARSLTWDRVLSDRWVLLAHKTAHKSGRPRVVYLNSPMQRLMRVMRREALQNACDEGTVFLNGRGEPWTRNAVRLRLQRIKKTQSLPADLTVYLARHAFGTQSILNGVDAMTVAELMGHTSLDMVSRVYVHLAGKDEHLNSAVERATLRRYHSKPSGVGRNPDA